MGTRAAGLTGRDAAQSRPYTTAGQRGALAALCLLLFVTFLDNTVVSVALGSIQAQLHAGVSDLQWVVNGYALVFACLMLPAAGIGDEYGRKKVLLAGAVIFCVGSVMCGLAPSVGWLIAGRAVMGLGAAGSEPGTLSMIRQLFPDDRSRAQAIGWWAAVSGIALAMGPVIGGALVSLGSWRWIFWFNLLLGGVALAVGARTLPDSADPQGKRLDLLGSGLIVVALGCAVYAVIAGENAGYGSTLVISLFAAAAVALVGFVARERRAEMPLVDLSLIRLPGFAAANVAAFTVYFGTFALFFFTALYLDVVVGQSGYEVALQFLPLTAGLVLTALVVSRWIGRFGQRWPVVAGCAAFGGGLLLTDATLNARPAYAPLAASLALAGVGIGMAVVPLTSAVLAAVPARRSGMAASITNTSREIGAVAGVAVLGALVNARLTGQLGSQLDRLGLGDFRSLVLNAVEHGGLPSRGGAPSPAQASAGAGSGDLIARVINAAYGAFGSALSVSLVVSAALVFATAVLAALAMGRRQPEPT